MKRARVGQGLRYILDIVAAHDEGLRHEIIMEELERRMPPLQEENVPSSVPGRSKYRLQMYFNTVGLTKAGWISRGKGTWRATESGRIALATYPAAEAFLEEIDRLYQAWKDERDSAEGNVDVTNVLEASMSIQDAEDTAGVTIRDHLGAMPPYDFQELIGHLLRAMGYHVPYIAEAGPDGGIDLMAFEDPLGARGARVKVQAKRTQSTVGRPTVQALVGALSESETGVVVALSGFSRDAETYAKHQNKRVTLIDGARLIELWTQHYDRVPEEGRSLLRLRPVYYLDRSK
jgi:restriction system protein